MQQEAITRWQPVYQDEEQVLLAFEITWCVSVLWTFAIKWPYSIRSLFFRRCVLRQADYVAIFVPEQERKDLKHDSKLITILKRFLATMFGAMDGCMAFLFSAESHGKMQGSYQYCRVQVDDYGSRHFFFNFRRYNLDEETGVYVPGGTSTSQHKPTLCLNLVILMPLTAFLFLLVWEVGATIGDLHSLRDGLSTDDVSNRMRVVGPNTIRMRRPNVFRTIFNEFSKPFYTYQFFMVWVWFPFWYWYMALVNATVITSGGLTVSFFQYRNDKSLYLLTHISGEAKVLRDSQYVTIPQKELVPGDVVVIEPGLTYCDVVIVQSPGILVDESALTGESTPMAKTEIDPLDGKIAYDRVSHKKNTIYAGTSVSEAEATQSLAVVTSTGSFTTKGELLRSILSYERPMFKFDTEVKLVLIILVLYAIFAFAMVIYFIQDTAIYGWFYGM
jgi:hypothetical protein